MLCYVMALTRVENPQTTINNKVRVIAHTFVLDPIK